MADQPKRKRPNNVGVGLSQIKSAKAKVGVGTTTNTRKGPGAKIGVGVPLTGALSRPKEAQRAPKKEGQPKSLNLFDSAGDNLKSLAENLMANAPQPEPGKTFEDYLKMANDMATGGTDYGALEGQLRRNGSEGDARLEAMYRQLRGSIDSDAPAIQQNYDEAGAAFNSNADQAAANTKAAAEAARAQQAKQFGALGIQEGAQQVLASDGARAATDQAAAVAGIENNRLANTNQNAANKASAVNYNTGVGNAVGLEGATQRSALQQALANKLAELQTAQSQENAQRQSSVYENALQIQAADQDDSPSAREKFEAEQQYNAAKLALQQLKAQGSRVTLDEILDTSGQLQGVATKAGIPEDQYAQWLKNQATVRRLL